MYLYSTCQFLAKPAEKYWTELATVGRGLSKQKSAGTGKKTTNILLQVNKKHSKNALIYIPISMSDSPLHGASFELTYLYNMFCLGPENYITILRTPKILYKCS